MRFTGLTKEAWFWFYERLRVDIDKATTAVVGYDGDEIKVMAVFQDWTPNSATVHFVMEDMKYLRKFLEEAFNYVYVTSGRKILTTRVMSDNIACLSLVKMIGFREVFRLEDGFDEGNDIVVHQLDKDECRFLNGQENSRAA